MVSAALGACSHVTISTTTARITTQNPPIHFTDAGALRTVSGQTGTLVLDIQGQVLSATGELRGTSGEIAAETIFSMLQDSSSVLDANQKEELQRMTINFPSYDYVVTLDAEQLYVVKRSTVQE